MKVSRPSRPFPGHWHLHASHSQPGDKEDAGKSEYKTQHELKVTLSVSDTIMPAGEIELVTNVRIMDRIYCVCVCVWGGDLLAYRVSVVVFCKILVNSGPHLEGAY